MEAAPVSKDSQTRTEMEREVGILGPKDHLAAHKGLSWEYKTWQKDFTGKPERKMQMLLSPSGYCEEMTQCDVILKLCFSMLLRSLCQA